MGPGYGDNVWRGLVFWLFAIVIAVAVPVGIISYAIGYFVGR